MLLLVEPCTSGHDLTPVHVHTNIYVRVFSLMSAESNSSYQQQVQFQSLSSLNHLLHMWSFDPFEVSVS